MIPRWGINYHHIKSRPSRVQFFGPPEIESDKWKWEIFPLSCHLYVCMCSYSPSFIFRIMEPWYLLIFQNFWNFNETSQVNTLSISDDNFLLLYTVVAYIIRIIGNVLYISMYLWGYGFFFITAAYNSSSNISMKGWKIERKDIIKYKANKLCCYIRRTHLILYVHIFTCWRSKLLRKILYRGKYFSEK